MDGLDSQYYKEHSASLSVWVWVHTYKVMWYYECKVTGEETKEWWNGKTTAGMTFFISHINKNKLSAPFQSKILPTHLKPLTFINTRKPRILSET